MPQYIQDILAILEDEYSIQYREVRTGDYDYTDCIFLNGICITIDRLEVDILSNSEIMLVVNSIRDLYITLEPYYV